MTSSKKPTSTVLQPTGAADGRRMNIKMVQNVLLIWLHNNIDENNSDCRNTTTQLRRVINTINTFTDGEDCIQFLEDIEDEKACMIISGSLGEHIVPRVHDMSQVDSIFIFCSNKQFHEQWTKQWPKIKGVHTDIKSICDALKQSAIDCEQNAIAFSVMATDEDMSKKNLDQLDPMFMYSQIIKEILLVINFEQQHINDFAQYCRQIIDHDNTKELEIVQKLRSGYRENTPIWWYTLESFLYPMLNQALRLSDINVIIKMGFFIGDLHRQIDELHKGQFSGVNANKQFLVYRGQGMSKQEFEKVFKTKGGLISFNNFLSTSTNDKVSLGFAKRALSNPEFMGVLFVMTIDPSQSTTPFASVASVGVYANRESEILFAMNTVFRIKDIQRLNDHSRLFQVELALTGDNDNDLRVLTDRIREESCPNEEG